jgi:hypothetical protein
LLFVERISKEVQKVQHVVKKENPNNDKLVTHRKKAAPRHMTHDHRRDEFVVCERDEEAGAICTANTVVASDVPHKARHYLFTYML